MSDFALRLPAALFGIMTIPLIFFVGQQVFDRRVGLLAAAIYTFCPQAVIWAQYLWHPQQTQFFALLTSYLFYQAIRATPISPRYLYPATVAFVATYLSWEGSGFSSPRWDSALRWSRGRCLVAPGQTPLDRRRIRKFSCGVAINPAALAPNPVPRRRPRPERCQHAYALLS